MKTIAQPNATRLFAAAAALCFLQHALAMRAEASCGDYVLVHGLHSGASMHDRMEGRGSIDSAAEERASQASPANRRAPCHGPQCSKRSVPPVAPSPASSSERHDWSWSAPEILVPAINSCRLEAVEGGPRSAVLGDSIFRPPRSVAPALA